MLYYAGILHDVGYVAFKNQRMLADMGVMSVSEELHPLLSVKMLEGIKLLEGALPYIQHHHERYDGTGYPAKLKGEDIPLGARILGLVESLEELRLIGVSGAELEKHARQEAADGKGTRFDPKVVEACLSVLADQGGTW